MSILFSIIIPVYNVEQHISRCLESIVRQSYHNLEIIIINDGSTDSSGAICDQYAQNDKRIKVIHQNNLGVSSARNSGLEIATGDYISFIDSDDWIESNMYTILVKYLINKDIDILRFNALRKNEVLNKIPFEGKYSDKQLENEIKLPLIGSQNYGGMFILGVLWLHVYKRDIIDKHQIRFNKELRRCEDRLFTIQAILHSQTMLFITDVLYHYEVYNESLSNKYDKGRWEQEKLFLHELQKEYSTTLEPTAILEANKRIKNDSILRAVMSVNNEFFSNNNNSFKQHYLNTRKILTDPLIIEASKNLVINNLSLKDKITLQLLKQQQPFILTIFYLLLKQKQKI